MKINFKYFNLNLSYWFIIIIPLLLATGYLDEYGIAMLSTALHEFGHMTAAMYKGCRIKTLKVTPAGLNVIIDEMNCSKSDLICIYIFGPAVNIVIASISMIFCVFISDDRQVIRNLFILNSCLALFNLLPAMPLDGGKILFEALSGCFGIAAAEKFTAKVAIFLSTIFVAAGVWLLIWGRGNFSLLIIGIFILVSLADRRMEASFMNIRQILYRRSRLLKKGIYPARELVAMKWMHLGECLKCMDYDRIHLIHVLDDDMTVMAVFTESEIIEAMLSNASDLSFEELVSIYSSNGKGNKNAAETQRTGEDRIENY